MLEAIVGNSSAEKVLLFMTARKSGYALEIAKTFDTQVTPIKNQLERMEREGLFVVENVGRTKVYTFNPRFQFLEEVTSLGEKALSFLPDPLRDTLIFNRRRPRREGLIGQTLTDHGIDAVLTGGSCLAIYSSERWVSQDLDLIDISFSDKSKIVKALSTIGFLNKGPGPRYYEHPECKFPIEFPTGPLAIGEEAPISSEGITEITTPHGTFKILSTTNCVKDRLINYLLYNDMQCLDQARYVAQNKPVDMNNITNWLRNEGSDLDPRELLLETKLTSFPPSLDR